MTQLTNKDFLPYARVSSTGKTATYPYHKKEIETGLCLMTNFPGIPKAPTNIKKAPIIEEQCSDLVHFWKNHFKVENISTPPSQLDILVILEHMGETIANVTAISKMLFGFTIGGDNQAKLAVGHYFPIFQTTTDMDDQRIFDNGNKIDLFSLIPQEWIEYEFARNAKCVTWLHHWRYDKEYVKGKAGQNTYAVTVENILVYDFLSQNLYLRVLLQRWLNTFLETYLYVLTREIQNIRRDIDSSPTVCDDSIINSLESVIKARSALLSFKTRMVNYWFLKGDPKSDYDPFIKTVSVLLDDALLNITRER